MTGRTLVSIAFMLIALLPATIVFGAPTELPQTGQIICYDAIGGIIPCTDTGQDGEVQAGVDWPNPRFIDNSNGTITDKLTGLAWTKDANLIATRDPSFDADGTASDGKIAWQHALDYIKKLNTENYLGFSDWRLPNIVEMMSILNLSESESGPFLQSHGFNNIQQLYEYYWTSSNFSFYNYGSVWLVNVWKNNIYRDGVDATNCSSCINYLWPVRDSQTSSTIKLPKTGQTTCYDMKWGDIVSCTGTGQDAETQKGVDWPVPRFTVNADQTVKDNLTGLIWSQNGNAPGPTECHPGSMRNWTDLLDYAKCINSNNYLGYNDWRIPNRNELFSLMNYSQSYVGTWLNNNGFQNIQDAYYLSSTTVLNYPTNVYGLSFSGYSINPYKTESSAVIALRGGRTKFTPVNGTCGSANGSVSTSVPNYNFCTTGTASSVSGSGPWTWSCVGSNGGTTASCSAQLQVNGACGSSNSGNLTTAPSTNLCASGSSSSVTGSGPWNWGCTGSNGGTAASCSAQLQVNGACGSANGATVSISPSSLLCATDAASNVSGSGPWNWSCFGVNGGSLATCSASLQTFAPDGILNPITGKTKPDITDAVRILQITAGKISATAADLSHGDIAPLNGSGTPGGDGKLDVYDVIGILRMIVGLIY